jgi:predicted dehydrogenase
MQKVKVGLLGAGGIATQHLQVLQDMEWMEVVGITSRTRTKAEKLAQEYGISDCEDSVASLINKTKPDALMVLVSADQMYRMTAEVIPCGLPLFIEKPAGLSPEETSKLAHLARQHSVQTMVGFNRRYYSIFHKGMHIIREHGPVMGIAVEGHERIWRVRETGKFPEKVMAQWIFANGVHTIDLLRFFGGEARNFTAIAHKYREPRGDQFAAVMELESGALGHYSAFWYSPGGWRVVLYGDGVTVEFKPLEQGIWTDKDFKSHEITPDDADKKYKPGFYAQLVAFGNMVRENKSEWPALDLEGAYKTMALAERLSQNVVEKSGALESLISGKKG